MVAMTMLVVRGNSEAAEWRSGSDGNARRVDILTVTELKLQVSVSTCTLHQVIIAEAGSGKKTDLEGAVWLEFISCFLNEYT